MVPLLARPTFLPINTLARSAGAARSRRDNQSMRERCCKLLAQARGGTLSHINASKADRAGRVTLFPGTIFFHKKGDYCLSIRKRGISKDMHHCNLQ